MKQRHMKRIAREKQHKQICRRRKIKRSDGNFPNESMTLLGL